MWRNRPSRRSHDTDPWRRGTRLGRHRGHGAGQASSFRFHLDRDVDFVQYAITKKRLLAGSAGQARQLHFFIAEEGITAAAYVVVSIIGRMWTLEECGDRDPSGARSAPFCRR